LEVHFNWLASSREKNMRRREFIKNTLGGTLTLAAAQMAGVAFAEDPTNAPVPVKPVPAQNNLDVAKLRGVNLGSWLVLERWMVPTLYGSSAAQDEYSLCLDFGAKAKSHLDRHRDKFITASDFRWIRDYGLNAVRLPVGYWALEASGPYVESSRYIQFALDECQRNGLKLLLDLHGAPGSQNGWDHSGRSGPINWHKDPQNIAETIRVLESFAQKFGKHPALFGIELLNEPRNSIPLEILQQFYQDAYVALRKQLDPQVAIVIHDSFRPLDWKNFMQEPAFTNVILDTHLYQCFDDKSKSRDAFEQIAFSANRNAELNRMQREELPTLVGEWSLSLPPHSVKNLSRLQLESASRAYGSTQILNYEATRGWFFWSYKLEANSEWNFRYCAERNWLQGNFAA
jgi:glucan 1,3-beta-glucosidase